MNGNTEKINKFYDNALYHRAKMQNYLDKIKSMDEKLYWKCLEDMSEQ